MLRESKGAVNSLSELDEEVEVVQRRHRFTTIYDALPVPASAAFWSSVASADMPLEVIVRCLRDAASRGDVLCRNQLLSLIVQRTQTANEHWAHRVLKTGGILPGEHRTLADDLYADLCERMLHAVLDARRHFWEEHFFHCLYFERKHVFCSLMMREGRWYDPMVVKSERIPRAVLKSLDSTSMPDQSEAMNLEIEDLQAAMMFRAIDSTDLLQFVMRLPAKLSCVVLLVFWEECTEKEAAQVLGITDRTIRNRLQKAFKMLRSALLQEERQVPNG